MKIEHIHAREILDSRGKPTVEVDLAIKMEDGRIFWGRASAPSGASVGQNEALELRDRKNHRYYGYGVQSAVNSIQNTIAPQLLQKDFFHGLEYYKDDSVNGDKILNSINIQLKADSLLLNIYRNNHGDNITGSNAILPVSLALAKALAKQQNIPLFLFFRVLLSEIDKSIAQKSTKENITSAHDTNDHLDKKAYSKNKEGNSFKFPIPMLNLINGGVHADNSLDIQEFMIVPIKAQSISEALQMASEIFMTLQANLKKNGYSTNVGDEGGFASNFTSTRQALDILMEAVHQAGYSDSINIALDVASSEFYKNGQYVMKGEDITMSSSNIIKYYQSLVDDYPIFSIEDAIAENDLQGWKDITSALGNRVMLVGDDLFTTNSIILQNGIKQKIANSILIKPNQVGTLTETLKTISLAKAFNYKIIISHRSGETEDTTIAHLAYGTNSTYIKAGSICRTDRICKYNEMIRISEYIQKSKQNDIDHYYL